MNGSPYIKLRLCSFGFEQGQRNSLGEMPDLYFILAEGLFWPFFATRAFLASQHQGLNLVQ
jgi:hypothetical protein